MIHLAESSMKMTSLASTREQALAEVSELLLMHGCVTERYVATIRSCGQSDECMVIAPWLAVAYCRSEQEVLKSGIGLLTLQRPVRFGFEATETVRLVVALAAQNVAEHMGQLDSLGKLLARPGRMERLCQAQTEQQARKILAGC